MIGLGQSGVHSAFSFTVLLVDSISALLSFLCHHEKLDENMSTLLLQNVMGATA